MAQYFRSKTESPPAKHRKLQIEETRASAELALARAREVEVNSTKEMHANEMEMRREEARLAREARAQDMEAMKDILSARGESPDSKKHRKIIEAKDAETRRVQADARAAEISTNRDFQMKMWEMFAKKN